MFACTLPHQLRARSRSVVVMFLSKMCTRPHGLTAAGWSQLEVLIASMASEQPNAHRPIFLAIGKTSALHRSGHGPDVTSYDVAVKNE